LCKPGLQLDFQSKIRAFLLHRNNARRAINMTLHEMSAEPSSGWESALQVHGVVRLQFFQIRAVDCFLEKIEGETIAASQSQCETTAIHSDAVAGPRVFSDGWRGNLQLRAAIGFMHLKDVADFLDQAGEHDDPLFKSDFALKRASLTSERLAGYAGRHLRVATSKFASL
jgi:hypothetical protein